MIQSHFEDTHLCIKCSRTIVGLENYIEHRKQNCLIAEDNPAGNRPASHHDHDDEEEEEELEGEERAKNAGPPQLMISTPRSNDHSYGPFEFPEPDHEAPLGQHGGKTGKSLGESYDLPYDLCADAFFSSLQLQSVQTGGKSGSHVVRDKADHNDTAVSWIETSTPAGGAAHQSTDNLMKAVQDLSGSKKPYEAMFKPISFGQDSPDVSDDEEEEEEIVPGEIYDDDDEEDDDQMPHSSGGKWKFPLQSHSPPVVPVTHTGGKWKPEHRPSIHVTHTQLARISPNWDDPAEEPEGAAESGQHPPAEHTKGKWVPQTKTQRLDYKEKSLSRPQQVYWCNICCRKLKTRTLYDKHLKTMYHLKRAEREVHLERADLDQSFLSQAVSVEELREACQQTERRLSAVELKKGSRRRRRKTFVKCEICRLVVRRHLIGKHLICHYHYRRMQMSRGHLNDALAMLLENIHQVVFQSPFQCLPCRFYFNTEEAFLQHWSSASHRKVCEGPGRFWCQLCDFTCVENAQMLDHLMGFDHREVVKVINRSFPICIAKKLDVECLNCSQTFRYNVELRKHLQMYHPDCGEAQKGTASASYQRLFKCRSCGESLHSKVALQRHEKNAHSITKYFCTACCMEFATACQARRHRKTMGHRKRTKEGEGEHDAGKSLRQEEASPLACDKCNFRASSDIEAMLHSIGHQEATEKSSNENRATSLLSESTKKPSEVSKPSELSKHTSPAKKSKNKAQKCQDCAEEFPSLEDLLRHREEKHPLLRHVCMMCGDTFPTSQALGRHSRGCQAGKGELPVSLSNKDKWSCEQCNFKASYESELIYHGFFHTHGVLTKHSRLACPFCGKISGRDSLRCHLRLHTNEKIFECEICKLKFSRRHNLKDHINKFHRRPEATTTGVAAVAAAAERLTTDVTDGRLKTTTAPSPAAGHQGSNFPCLTCGKVFLSQTLLAQHCGTHDEHGERNFTCTHEGCHYVGLSGERLQRHMAKHTPDPLKCPVEGCPYVGSSETNLKKHSKSKHAPASTLYKCDICDFTDRSKAHLQRHLRTHTGEKPFGCPYCDVRCNTFDNIRKHILKTNNHPGRYVYECKLCQAAGKDAIFKSNSNVEYKKHLKDEHHGGKVG